MYEYDPDRVFAYLDQCARKKGYNSANALSEAAGIEPSAMSRLKTGKAKSPGIIPLVSLFRAADASLDVAFGLKNDDGSDSAESTRDKHRLELTEQELAAKERLLAERDEQIKMMRDAIKVRNRIILIQTLAFAVIALAAIGLVIYDKVNPHVGWFRDTANAVEACITSAVSHI